MTNFDVNRYIKMFELTYGILIYKICKCRPPSRGHFAKYFNYVISDARQFIKAVIEKYLLSQLKS